MERYIIPFDYQDKSYYVFIDKDAERLVYVVKRLMPAAEEPYHKEIPFSSITAVAGSNLTPVSLEEAIIDALYKFLLARGWVVISN